MAKIIEEKCPVCGGDIAHEVTYTGRRVERRIEAYWCAEQGKRIGGHLGPNWRPTDVS